MDEIVALYDEHGRPVGSAPRSRMRAENLRHAATGVVVRDSWGRVFVHRRTDTKDVYPGRYDFTAGGVLLAGEDPDVAAVRELEEELGITAPLRSLGEADYADNHTNYHAFLYETTWDGPVQLQPEEVASGEWLTLEALAAMLADPEVSVMPDAAAVLAPWLRERLADQADPEQGWDSHATIVEGRWLDRTPRRPEVADRLRAETVLLPAIAPLLPLAVPVPTLLEDDPVRVRHVLVPGAPVESGQLTAADGHLVGRFLKTLHGLDPQTVGVRDAATLRSELDLDLSDFAARVVPLLPADRRSEALALLGEVVRDGPTCLIHGDLGPQHLFATSGRVSGVIDWTDAGIGDPATDLAWALNGTPEEFARALATTYGVDDELAARARTRHRLGPWWEVTAGLDFLGPVAVESGLAGILARL